AVPQQVHPLDAVAPQLRRPQVLAQIPRRLGELLVGEPPARLDDADAVALLRQPQRRDAATEAGADDEDVVVEVRAIPTDGVTRSHTKTVTSGTVSDQR